MPKYQTNAQRRYRYDKIARAEGEQCLVHFVGKGIRRGPPSVKLEIDHADSNSQNWNWKNTHLVCHKCNCLLRDMPEADHLRLIQGYSDQLEKERERENLPTWKTVLKGAIPYESGSPEMQANRNFEPKWLKYVHGVLGEDGQVKKKQLISGAAYFSNCSIQTSTNYLTKYCAPGAVFKESFDGEGDKIIIYTEV